MLIPPVDNMEQKTVLQELHVIIDEFDNKSRTEIKAVLCWVLHTFNLCFTSFIKHKSTEGENKRQQRSARWAVSWDAACYRWSFRHHHKENV